MAGAAAQHQHIAGQYSPGDELPCADAALLVPLKRSAPYRAIRDRVAQITPIDAWQDAGLHFFVFPLQPVAGGAVDGPPVAVFAMEPHARELLSAVVVTPRPGIEEAEVTDLLLPGVSYTAPLT